MYVNVLELDKQVLEPYSSLFPAEFGKTKRVTPFSAHCISDHRISDQKVRTVMVRAIVRVRVRARVMVRARIMVRARVMVRVWVRVTVRVRLGDAVVRNAVGRKVVNHC